MVRHPKSFIFAKIMQFLKKIAAFFMILVYIMAGTGVCAHHCRVDKSTYLLSAIGADLSCEKIHSHRLPDGRILYHSHSVEHNVESSCSCGECACLPACEGESVSVIKSPGCCSNVILVLDTDQMTNSDEKYLPFCNGNAYHVYCTEIRLNPEYVNHAITAKVNDFHSYADAGFLPLYSQWRI